MAFVPGSPNILIFLDWGIKNRRPTVFMTGLCSQTLHFMLESLLATCYTRQGAKIFVHTKC